MEVEDGSLFPSSLVTCVNLCSCLRSFLASMYVLSSMHAFTSNHFMRSEARGLKFVEAQTNKLSHRKHLNVCAINV